MDELKLELVRDLTKKVYGENYNQQQYEHMLTFYHDFNNFLKDLYLNGLNFCKKLHTNSLNKLDIFVKNLSTSIDNYKKNLE